MISQRPVGAVSLNVTLSEVNLPQLEFYFAIIRKTHRKRRTQLLVSLHGIRFGGEWVGGVGWGRVKVGSVDIVEEGVSAPTLSEIPFPVIEEGT